MEEDGNQLRRVLFDIQHPAQVHLFKHVLWELQEKGVETMVLSRDKELTLDLLDAYGIRHLSLSRRKNGLPAAVVELGVREYRTIRAAWSFQPDVIVSRVSPPAVHAASLVGAKSVIVTDTDIESTLLGRVFHGISLPFADVVCRPPGLELSIPRRNQEIVGPQELAYLHPNRFRADPNALEQHGVDVDEPYFVIRLSGWDAYHDIGHQGLSETTLKNIIQYLSGYGQLYLSSETGHSFGVDLPEIPVPPHLIHDLLYHADLYIGDSGTMSTEAALLGTPAIRSNSIPREQDELFFRELEAEHGLLFSVSTDDVVLRKVKEIISDDRTQQTWCERRKRFLEDASDVTDQLVSIIRAVV